MRSFEHSMRTYKCLILSGHSMYPAIKNQDSIEVEFFNKPKSVDYFSDGEVLLFRTGQEWVIHRVVSQQGQKISKGDWTQVYDQESFVWGKVHRVNGRQGFELFDPAISQLSAAISSESRLLRRWTRLKIIFYVNFKKMIRVFYGS